MHSIFPQLNACIIEFVQLLRRAGLNPGTDAALKAIEALTRVPLDRHGDLYWALRATLVTGIEQQEIFDQVFNLYWQHQDLSDSGLTVSLPRSKVSLDGEKNYSRRTMDAFERLNQPPENQETEVETIAISWSDTERLQQMDFESMSAGEFIRARQLIARMKALFRPVASRRYKDSERSAKIDLRRSLKNSVKYSAQFIDIKHKIHKMHYPPLVLIIDISGSMSRYAQIMLLFAHVLHKARANVHVFTFATRLSAVSRLLSERDIDLALAQVGESVTDWNSGTRIGQSIHDFNHSYSRRILNTRGEVLFVSDGLDRGDNQMLDKQMALLGRSCKRLIWLNPLLRYENYQPRARGASTILSYVDALLPVHNLSSVEQLVKVLGASPKRTPVSRAA